MNRKIWARPASLVVLIIAFCCILPFILGEFHLSIAIFLLINLMLVVGFRLITTVGLWSFAHVALMGVGGYTSGLLVIQLGCSFWLALLAGVLASAFVSLLIGLPCVRTRGFQFFIASYAAGEAIRWAWIIFREPFGGYAGIGVIPRPDPILGISLANTTSYYYLVLLFTLLGIAAMYWLEKSRIGDVLKSIASNEDLCKSVGINTYGYKILVFVVASSFAGLAGVLFSFFTATASPGDYTFVYSINILIFVVAGGTASFAGPIVGTFVLTIIGELLRGFLEYLPLFYGAILIVIVLILPGGLASLLGRMPPAITRMQMLRKKIARWCH